MGREIEFPNLDFGSTKKTSPATLKYNCVAWAAEEEDRWWWPDTMSQAYWPNGIPRARSLESFMTAFSTLGYAICADGNPEEGFQKIAIYADSLGRPTHVARQLGEAGWTSKLGKGIDIGHELDGLKGTKYGAVVQFMKRPITQASR